VINPGGAALKVLVPADTPMSQAILGSRADVKPGDTIFVAARREVDGKLAAVRV